MNSRRALPNLHHATTSSRSLPKLQTGLSNLETGRVVRHRRPSNRKVANRINDLFFNGRMLAQRLLTGTRHTEPAQSCPALTTLTRHDEAARAWRGRAAWPRSARASIDREPAARRPATAASCVRAHRPAIPPPSLPRHPPVSPPPRPLPAPPRAALDATHLAPASARHVPRDDGIR